MDAENREEAAPAMLTAGDVQKDLKFISGGFHRISCLVKRDVKNMNYAAIMCILYISQRLFARRACKAANSRTPCTPVPVRRW